ncbi:beta-chimaerin [Viridothelium virens]|uniref:Beta-chimaerin n=1 Tax=Viridothelium virens TaxID=1048519 RepID=A0A6A6GT47_VIRVR|nr:beta-chimaerin [Viridothelium virens]
MATNDSPTSGVGNGFHDEDLGSPTKPEPPLPDVPQSATEGVPKAVDEVIYSDIGVNTLLTRLKQSIASARDFAAFLKKRSSLEEDQAQGLKKLCKSTHDGLRRPEGRQGTYSRQFDELTRMHERMADNGMQFALSLHQMHEDLNELANNMERGRKNWKQTGLNAEKRASDAEASMEKAKSKYESLAEAYDRARTGDKSSGRAFGIKGPKSAAQHEEDLQRKVQAADADYKSKVEAAQTQRQELLNSSRPQAVRALQELITECDSALTLQLQKFASFNEKLLLGNGIIVSPLKNESNGQRSMRDVVYDIDNEKDLHGYISSHAPKIPLRNQGIEYKQHPSLAPKQQAPQTTAKALPLQQPQSSSQPPASFPMQPPSQPSSQPGSANNRQSFAQQQSFSPQSYQPPPPDQAFHSSPQDRFMNGPPPIQTFASQPPYAGNPQSASPYTHQQTGVTYSSDHLPPVKPVFGVSLDDLFHRDGSAVPMVVYQCIQAVELFGLEVEGIYRMSGNSNHIAKLKSKFDHDSSRVDFRNPESFYHDVNSVAGLLKLFFRDLPDPLLTGANYSRFIEAAQIDDDIVRRDSLHAVINELPDPNYATLRALILHLHRVSERSAVNRMSSSNLALCFAPTVLGAHSGAISDSGYQARVVDTVLQNTFQIFDED